jgi:tRNA(Ile)-lysidine synthase
VLAAVDNFERHVAQQMHEIMQVLKDEKAVVETFVVAFSGGVDSMVLLTVLARLWEQGIGLPLQVVHVNHGLSDNALQWQEFCQQVCDQYQLPFHLVQLSLQRQPRKSLEELARDGRYQELFDFAHKVKGAVLTGQHQDDQLETVLLQLKRGAGVRGLAGMPKVKISARGMIARPLLTVSQQDIKAYAASRGLTWVEDESNQDETFDRNFLRQTILPSLTARWPSLGGTVSRSAQLCAESQRLIDDACDERLSVYRDNKGSLAIDQLKKEPVYWQRGIVRRWLDVQGVRAPSASQLEQILNMGDALMDRQPEVKLKSVILRRFKDRLYLCDEPVAFPLCQTLSFERAAELPFSQQKITLTRAEKADAIAIQGDGANAHWTLVTGMPALRIRPQGKGHSKKFKDWLKLWEVPPWLRGSIPLLCCHGEPVAVLLSEHTVLLVTDFTQEAWIFRTSCQKGNYLPLSKVL